MDPFYLQLIVLFVPGIIWERIDNRFGVNRPNAQFDILRRALCFGLTAYAALFVLAAAVNGVGHHLHPDRPRLLALAMVDLQKDKFALGDAIFPEVAAASLLALGLSLGWLYITNNKLPVRFMQHIKATRRFGDEDVWDYMFNSRGPEAEYVHVRDFESELNFSGWVELFSETGATRELLLRDVDVTTFAGDALYTTPRIYLGRPVDKITIEFPVGKARQENEHAELAAAGESGTEAGRTPDSDA